MKKNFIALVSLCSILLASPAFAQPSDISFKHEVEHAIDRGLDWLKSHQNDTNGSWSTPDQPAVTALALTAFMGQPNIADTNATHLQRGYSFITSFAKPDGAIFNKGLQNYNTAICAMALLAAKNPSYEPMILRARQWLIDHQVDTGSNSPFNGGLGYGERGQRTDLNNTLVALETIYYAKKLAADKPQPAGKDLNWQAAIKFIQTCQNLPAYNKEPWASDSPENKGGFIYEPGSTKSTSSTNDTGRLALRSYGSISYAGLLSYIYCNVDRNDPRVLAVRNWLRDNYTLDENPGMGQAGLYYYLHVMAKALSASDLSTLQLKDGRAIDWRHDLAMKLINLQKTDGSWSNENNRWWEKDPALVTSYSVMSLELLYHKL